MTVPIHCMQGRLIPPWDRRIQAFPARDWERELTLASEAGIEGIEWIYEVQGAEANPLGSDSGLARVAARCAELGIVVESLCADWFMERPLLRDLDGGTRKLCWLLDRCSTAGIRRVVLPFVDASSLRDCEPRELVELLRPLISELEDAGVELHLETSLPPHVFAELLSRIDHPLVKANYDTGNSASLGYDPREELNAYGDRIGSVHVKDRVRAGGTVPLGEGAANLELVFSLLRERGWNRPFVLQTARGEPGAELGHVRSDAEWVRGMWARSREHAWN